MEVTQLPGNFLFNDLDHDLDPIGIILEKEFICGYCRGHMEAIGQEVYRCVRCGFTKKGD